MLHRSSLKQSWVRNLKYIIVLIVIICVCYLSIYAIDQVTRITSIRVSGNTQKTVYGLQAYNKRSLLFVSERDISQNLWLQNVWWKNVTVQKRYPNQLVISVRMAIPVAYLHQNDRYILLSDSGRILQKEVVKSRSLPTITYFELIPLLQEGVGENIDLRDILKALVIIKGVRVIGLVPDSVDIDSRNMVALQIGSKKIQFSLEKTEGAQLYQLERIIKQFKIEGKTYKRIDLRFDKPVVEFEP